VAYGIGCVGFEPKLAQQTRFLLARELDNTGKKNKLEQGKGHWLAKKNLATIQTKTKLLVMAR
jgi:hypothetical protein